MALWDLASLLGNLNWATAAVPFAQANLRNIQNFYISLTKSAGGNLGVGENGVRLDKNFLVAIFLVVFIFF